MKILIITTHLVFILGLLQQSRAQSTTGGRSGGSTASTGTGYLTRGKRPAETSPSSMTIDDEGASRAYMYVPPTGKPNRSKSPTPDGSGRAKASQTGAGKPAASQQIPTGSGSTSATKRKTQ